MFQTYEWDEKWLRIEKPSSYNFTMIIFQFKCGSFFLFVFPVTFAMKASMSSRNMSVWNIMTMVIANIGLAGTMKKIVQIMEGTGWHSQASLKNTQVKKKNILPSYMFDFW